jgi:hypothetical protein
VPDNKNHHYVPKFLMRQFSGDPVSEKERTWVNLYLLKHRRFQSPASIAGQCQKPYFYGKDQAIENAMTTLEGRTKELLGNLSDKKLEGLTNDELFELRHLTFIQHQRTAKAAERFELFQEAMMKTSIERKAQRLGIDLNEFRIKDEFPQGRALLLAFESALYFEDLETCFLRSSRGTEFLLSDNPVSSNNQFAEHHPFLAARYPSACGIGCKGLQLFMPLSAEFCLAVYDPGTYQYGSGRSKIINVGSLDVKKINALQASQADSCLYMYGSQPDLSYLATLAETHAQAIEKFKVTVRKTLPRKERDGKMSQIISVNMADVRLGIKFSFVRIVNRVDYSGYNLGSFPPRSFQMHERAKQFRDELRAKARSSPHGESR